MGRGLARSGRVRGCWQDARGCRGAARLTDAAANPEGVVGSLCDVVRGIPVPWTRADSRCKEVWSA